MGEEKKRGGERDEEGRGEKARQDDTRKGRDEEEKGKENEKERKKERRREDKRSEKRGERREEDKRRREKSRFAVGAVRRIRKRNTTERSEESSTSPEQINDTSDKERYRIHTCGHACDVRPRHNTIKRAR